MTVVVVEADGEAAEAGIDEVRAEQLPADKASAITELATARPTAMVGDGLNDAPALATAAAGIAMGATGSAAAVESADIAFTGHDLRLIPAARTHARRGRRIMTANIALALAIIVVLFPLALFGVLGLAGVVLVHEVAEVAAVESACCSFVDWRVVDEQVHLRLFVTGTPEQLVALNVG